MTDAEYGRLKLDMRGVNRGARLYMGISGGLDSSYMAWRLLKRGHPILFHHCRYRTSQQRFPHEAEAHKNVLEWLTDQGLTDWKLIETEFSASGSMTYPLLDDQYLLWMAGLHLRIHKRRGNTSRADISHVVINSRQESLDRHGAIYQRMYRIMSLAAEREIVPIFPMERYTKEQMMADMPRELIELSWWCRAPVDGQPCNDCHSCRSAARGLAACSWWVEEQHNGENYD